MRHQNDRHALGVTRVVAICGALLAPGTVGLAQCVAPEYREAKVIVQTATDLEVAVRLGWDSATPASVICVAEAVRARHKDRQELHVLFFGSDGDAMAYHPFVPAPDTIAPVSPEAYAEYSVRSASHIECRDHDTHGLYGRSEVLGHQD